MRRHSSSIDHDARKAGQWWLLLMAVLCVGVDARGSQPVTVRVVSDERIAVEVAERAPCCPSRLSITATPVAGPPFNFEVEGRVQELTAVRLAAAGKLLVEGRLRYGGDVVLVVDLANRVLDQSLWAYGYALSPDATRLVYQTHYPRMALPEGRRSIVLLYDLRESPARNRSGDLPQDWPQWNAGRPVFPRKNACTGSPDIFLDGDYVVSSPFLWSPDGQRVVFFAGDQHSGKSILVLLDLTQGPCDGLRTEELDLEALVQRADRNGPLRFATDVLRWKSDEAKEVVAEPGPPFADRVTLPLP